MTEGYIGAFITLGGIMLIAGIVALLDWLAERKEKRADGSSR
jgi:hypothetical protein